MGLVHVQDLLAFPLGDNSSDTLIQGIHWNLTTLKHWNYSYYSNQTFSNGSRCFLLFEPYTPFLLKNGTFLNSTSCYSPIQPIGARSTLGLAFACFFALSIAFTLVNLRKHGDLFLPREKHFVAMGRRWQWYWMLAVAAFAVISGMSNIDVDRYYLPEFPLVFSNFFWFLMLPTTMAVVWESVRHWGSWQERQFIDLNPFMLRQDDRRSKVESYLPFLFYFCFWMNISMAVPRSWTNIERQRSSDQSATFARPTATDTRFKVAAMFLFIGWFTTVYSLRHSIKHYKPHNLRPFKLTLEFATYAPKKFLLSIPLAFVLVFYEAACSYDFSISPLNINANLGMMYGIGWGVPALILLVYEISGYFDPNEDQELIRQRRIRGEEVDRQQGIVRKPLWWRRLHGGNQQLSVQDQIARDFREIGRSMAQNLENSFEMEDMSALERDEGRRNRREPDVSCSAASLRFPVSNQFEDAPRGSSPGDSRLGDARGPLRHARGVSTTTGASVDGPSQQIRSMLDV